MSASRGCSYGRGVLRTIRRAGARAVSRSQVRSLLLMRPPFWSLFASPFAFGQVAGLKWMKVSKEDQSIFSEIVSKADQLYDDLKVSELYDFLKFYKDCENDEIMWRLCRAAYDKGKWSSDKNARKAFMYEAFGYAQMALALNSQNFACHKWYAILLDYTGDYEGLSKRLSNATQVKEHFQKAVELNPNDATTWHSLGYWCFIFADLSWYQRKIASAIFTAPPTSSYEEALEYFLRAEEIDPNFYSMNLVMLAKTYLRLGHSDEAVALLARTLTFTLQTPDDEQAHKEALHLLKKLGVKSS